MTPGAARPGGRARITVFATLAAGALGLSGTGAGVSSHPHGPPIGHTGGFGEPTCRACHESEEVNAPGGRLTVEGLPGLYEPGRAYDLRVRLVRTDMRRAGFQLALRYAAGDSSGRQAGVVAGALPRVVVVTERPSRLAYAQHTMEGSALSGGSTSWIVRWTAPFPGRGPVVLHVAANAGNDDNSPLGDYVYIDSVRSDPRRP